MPLVEIAEKLGVSPEQVRKWKHQDKWCEGAGEKKKVTPKEKVTVTKIKSNITKKEKSNVTKIEIDDRDLTEKQALFCFYFLKYWNAGKAVKKAGYECSYPNGFYEIGSQLLKKHQVRREIDRLKQNIREGIFMDAESVLQKYIDIAFSSLTDYVTFGQRQVQVMGAFGPVYKKIGEGETAIEVPVMKTVNYVDFKESGEVDGTLITEVSQGKDGAKIKFADKMKALEKLELYFDLLPDNWKRKVEEERLTMDREKLAIEKAKTDGPAAGEDDGFMEALAGKIEDVWDDYEGDDSVNDQADKLDGDEDGED